MPDQQSATAAGWIGHVLAGHRIDALLGEGGMGVVYRATHLRLRRTVALKVLPPPLAADHDYRRRFEREATIAASLEHPNVVPIYDAGHANGVLYLSMRYVDGHDLGAELQHAGPFGVERACAVLGPVADALDAVHEAGLVHRDVKPGNILIARSGRLRGQVYLCDFGIAKGAASGGGEITSAGTYMGTLQYSSPEQIEGRWLDGRSDQYGLACLAFRCLTGQVPYPRGDTAGVIYAHLAADPPRPGRVRPDLPPAVDAAIARAAAKHPDHRFPTCSAFVAALRAALGPPQGLRPRPFPAPATGPRPAETPPRRAPTRPLPPPETERQPRQAEPVKQRGAAAPAAGVAPPPVDVRAERSAGDHSITITWTAGGQQDVEYKISRQTANGRWHVVGRTSSTSIVDGAVPPDAAVPVYGVVSRLGDAVSEMVHSPASPPLEEPEREDAMPAVANLRVSPTGALQFEWPSGITEAMVVVRPDRPPVSPSDPAATAWKITNMRYLLDGGLLLPMSVTLPCHVAVASCQRSGSTLVVAPGFDPTAHVTITG